MSGYKLLIDGALVEGARVLEVVNPATGLVAEQCGCADVSQLNLAVKAAKAAFPAWSALGFDKRRTTLEALADAMDDRAADLARLLTMEQGKPLAQAQEEVGASIYGLRAFAAMKLETRTIRETASERIIEQRTPLGVVGAITPWNFPVAMFIMKIGPALITGNTVVAKPAPTTPLTALLIGELAAPLLPPGVLNIITDANDLGDALTGHPDVSKVAFTGSTATGRKVMASASGSVKRFTLELGGNDAAIVLDDANVQAVAPLIFASAMINAGQICFATKRVYAHISIYDALCGELARLAEAAVVDDGEKQGTTLGPVQNKAQFEKLKDFLADAHNMGKVIAGGEVLERDGYFVAPTIVRDIADDARLVREEQFGPILPVMSYEDIDDAIARTNDSEYGLAGSIWTADTERGIAVASRIDSGTVWVNKMLDMPIDVPIRGAKQSGFGVENGQEGLAEYMQARIVNVAL